MRLLSKLAKSLAVLVGLLIVAAGALIYATVTGGRPIEDGQRLLGIQVVRDGIVAAYIVDLDTDDKSVALVDAGNDREAHAILSALTTRGLGADAVKAILLTHGDRDHTAGVRAFPRAQVLVLEPDVALAEGREARGVFKMAGSSQPSGIKVTRALADGESVPVGKLDVRVFAVPGHTKGSAAFLARGVLFMGDSAESTKDGKLAPGKRLFTESPTENRTSLRALAQRLAPLDGDIKAIAPAHSGLLLAGLAPLTAFAAAAE